ncbi:hypothetical protein MCAMS1_00637 [biofilm metagenome]
MDYFFKTLYTLEIIDLMDKESPMSTLTHEKTVNAVWLIGAASLVVIPDVIFGVLLELIHLMLELVHLAFEVFESALDHLVEHIFHTGTKETQIIVFYIIVAMGLGAGYFMWSAVRRLFRKTIEALQLEYFHQKQRFLMFWEESVGNKFKLIAGFNVALTVAYLVSF